VKNAAPSAEVGESHIQEREVPNEGKWGTDTKGKQQFSAE